MTRTAAGSVLLAAFFITLASSMGAQEGQDRPARPRRRDRGATRNDVARDNDTQAAMGLSYGEVLALHRELRGVLDIHKAPSAREEEIVTRLKRMYAPSVRPEVELVNGGLAPGDDWGTGVMLKRVLGHLEREGAAYLDAAVSFADVMITAINDPQTGVFIPEDGVRAPVFVRYQPPGSGDYKGTIAKIRLRSPEEADRYEKGNLPVPHCANLSTAMALEGPVELAHWILDHPEVHNRPAPQIEGLRYKTGDTYGEKARFWLLRAKETFEHFEKCRPLDDKVGVWCKAEADPEAPAGFSPEVLPTNRFMIFNSVYLATGDGLRKLDPEAYGAWHERSRYAARRGTRFWKEVSINGEHLKTEYPKENQYGPLYVWGYSLNSIVEARKARHRKDAR